MDVQVQAIRKPIAIVIGSLMIAIGINWYLIPFKILDGGLIGIALIFKYVFGWNTGLTIVVCSIPIFVLAWYRYRFLFVNSLQGLLVSSFFIDLLYPFHFHFLYIIELSTLTSALLGGFLIGLGIGIMLRNGTSTGGTDLVAHWLADRFSLNVGFSVFVIDLIVVSIGGILISLETLVLSIMTILSGGIATSLMTLKN